MKNEDINITLEQALEKSSAPLRRKIQHSVEVIRKGYALWERFYKNDMPISLAFSAGKDSQALYHIAKMALTNEQWEKVDVFMSLTSVDPAPVIRFLKKEYPSVRRDMPKKSIYQMAIEHQMLPSMRVRWCCADMKENKSTFSFIGIRREESARRAKRNEVELMNHSFSGDFDTLEGYREEKVAKMKRQKKYKDYFDEHEESEVGCMGGKDRMTISPILHWTMKDVWEFLNDVIGATHCELYDQGQHRIGCLCCPMSSYKQKMIDIQKYPHVKERWLWAIKQIRNGGGITRQTYSHPDALQVRTNGRKNTGIWSGITPPITADAAKPNVQGSNGFSDSSSSDRTDEEREREIAEAILDWWISGKSYKVWYAEKYYQQHFDFGQEFEKEI